jgi:energy-coupling factor transporter ATP-binding protein EcfA2
MPSGNNAASDDAARHTCALVVGVEAYSDSLSLPPLKGAVESALKFYGWIKKCGVPEHQIFLHLSPCQVEATPATWQNFVASKNSLKGIEDADTLLIYWAGHGDIKKRNRRLYTEDGSSLQGVVDFNSVLSVLSSTETSFRTLFGFVDACAAPTLNKFNELRFPEDDSDPQGLQYVYFASSLGEEANYNDGGYFSSVLFDWLKDVRLPLDPESVDKALRVRMHGPDLGSQRPVRVWTNHGGIERQFDVDDQAAFQYPLAIKREWEEQPGYRRTLLFLIPQPGKTSEESSFLAPEFDALNRQFAELPKAAAPDESANREDPLKFLAKYGHAVLLGEPGSGKSTLLRAIQERLLQPQTGELPKRLRNSIPLFLDLSRWPKDVGGLDEFILLEATRLGADEFAAQWPALKKKRRFVLIFDGLDRMSQRPAFNPDDRTMRLTDQDFRVEQIRRAADDFICILSCRLREFDGSPVWRDLHLLPLADEEIRKFAEMAGFSEVRTAEFLDWLAQHRLLGRTLRDLAGTPYWLLRLLAFFHKAKTSTQKLSYEHLVLYTLSDALENLRYRKGLSKSELDKLRKCLTNLAFHMTAAKLRRAEKEEDVEDAQRWLLRDDPIDWFREALQPKRQLTVEHQAGGDRMLALSREAGVLLGHTDAIEFEHQLTQECFCLLYCMSHGIDEKLLAQAAQRQFLEVWRLWAQQQPTIVNEVVPYLYPAWGDVTMAHAAEVLGMLGDPRAVEPLLPLLCSRQGDFMVRLAVADTLGRIGDARALPDLLEVLRDDKETDTLRAKVAFALGLIGDPAAVDTLVGVLHADPDIATQAAHSLGWIGDPRAIEPLVGLLRDNYFETTLAAADALIWIGKPAIGALLDVLKTMAAGIGFQDGLRALVELGGANRRLLNSFARKHKGDTNTAIAIGKAESQVLRTEERKSKKPRHRGKQDGILKTRSKDFRSD